MAFKDYPGQVARPPVAGKPQRAQPRRAPAYNPQMRTGSHVPSPGVQEYGRHPNKVPPIRIAHGFTANLPGRTRIFFQRQFFANYPRPIQQGGASPFPRVIPVMSIEAPAQQAIVIRNVRYSAYQHSGIGIEDLQEVPEGRGIGTLGFRFQVGNRGLADYLTNLPGRGLPVNYGQDGGGLTQPRAGQGNTYQGLGTITPEMPNEVFAAYARPGMPIRASAVIFRPPSFDLRVFRVDVSGWLASEYELDNIIDHLSR